MITDLKNSILNELEIFIQNIGPNFIFLAQRKRFIIDGKICDFDFLMYSRDMRCLVPIDLKIGDRQIDDIERMKLKLQLLDFYRMHDGDDTPLGIILFVKNHARSVEIIRISKSQGWISKYLVDFLFKSCLCDFLKRQFSMLIKNVTISLPCRRQNERKAHLPACGSPTLRTKIQAWSGWGRCRSIAWL